MSAQERLGSDERRRQIVEAAMPVFASKGFSATTTKEIARSAGVSEALLYKYFPSKEHLFKELDTFCTPETFAVSDGLVAQGASTQTLVMGVYFMTRLGLSGPPGLEKEGALLKRLLVQSLLDDGQFACQFMDAKFIPYIPALELAMEEAEKAGDLEPGVTRARVRIILAHHLPLAAHLFCAPHCKPAPTGLGPDELLVETVQFVLRGLGLKPEAIRRTFDPQAASKWFEQAFAAATVSQGEQR